MVKRLKREYPDVPASFTCKKSTAKLIIESLDVDKNGSVEKEEFVEWVLKGAEKSRLERQAFAKSGKEFFLVSHFLDFVLRFARKIHFDQKIEALRPALMRIFSEASEYNSESGHMNTDGLIKMVEKLKQRYPDVKWPGINEKGAETIANTVIEALDGNGNGTIEMDEWTPWILKGISQTAVQRQRLLSSSKTMSNVCQFADSIGKIAEKMTADFEKLRPVLVKLYKGATNSGGHMSADDILAFAEQMGKDYPDYSAVSGLKLDAKTSITIVEALDADGNGTIECEEWVDWLLRGMGKTKAQRDAFARGQPKFAKLREFLDAVQVVAEKEAGISTGLVEEGKITYRFVMPNDKEAVKITMKSAKVLQQVPALSALEDGDLEKIVDSMEYKSYNRENPLIVEQGSSADEFFIVIVGKVSIMVADKQGWPREHCKKNVFEWFGEERFLGLENDRYTFSAIATGDQQVWVLKLNCKENKILNDHSEEIVAAARASRNHAAASIFLKQLKE